MKYPTKLGGLRLCLAAAVMGVCGASTANAAVITLAQWMPAPSDPSPEMVYTAGVGLSTGPGAIGNNDGNLPIGAQTPGGLETDTPANAPIPFSFNSSFITGGTGYYDTTLTFTGMAPTGATIQVPIGGGINQDLQPLGPGTFTLISTGPSGSIILLSGNITGANLITGVNGASSAAQLDGNGVNYTGGAILAAMGGSVIANGNSMAIGMTALTPPLGVTGGVMNSFVADATGSFDVTLAPEPSTLGLLGAGMLMLKRRRS